MASRAGTLAAALVLAGCGGGSDDAAGPTAGGAYGPLDHVTAEPYGRLLNELDVVEGHEPAERALTDFQSQLEALVASGHLGKPDGIELRRDETLAARVDADTKRSFAELDALAGARRSVDPGDDASYVHLVYVDGAFESDGDDGLVLGFAWGGDSIVMLKDNIERACGGSETLRRPALRALSERVCEASEASVLLHELGHLLGLVDNGAPMVEPHKDEAHGAHDTDEGCLMYWLVERSGVVDVIADRFGAGDEAATPLCDACLADLAALQ